MNMKKRPHGRGFAHPENCSDDISVINFEGAKVRIVKINGEPWFVASDVCMAASIDSTAIRKLDEDEKGQAR